MKIIVCLALAVSAGTLLAQWEPAVRLTVEDSASHTTFNNARSIATGPESTVHVVWYDWRNGWQGEIYYKRSTDNGSSWSDDVRLTSSPGVSDNPCVAVSGASVHLVWEDSRDNVWGEVYYKRSTDAGLNWSVDARLTDDSGYSRNPVIAADSHELHVAWDDERRANPGPEIYYLKSTDKGLSWLPEQRLTNAMHESWYPSIGLTGSCVHVAWRDWRDRSFEIWYKRSTDRGVTWDSADYRLSTDLSNGSYNPTLTTAGSHVHVVWWDTRHSPFELYYRRSTDEGGTWLEETRLTVDSSGSYNPSIVASGPNVHVFWEALADYLPEISYKLSTDYGATWSADTMLTTRPDFYAVSPSCAVDEDRLHVVWTDFSDHQNGEIYHKRNLTGNAVGIADGPEAKHRQRYGTTIARNSLFVAGRRTVPLRDVTGRKVMQLHPGLNDASSLAPGVYFLEAGSRRVVKAR